MKNFTITIPDNKENIFIEMMKRTMRELPLTQTHDYHGEFSRNIGTGYVTIK